MANFQIPAPASGKRPVDTYEWLGKILEVMGNTKGVEWYTNNILTIKQLGDSIGNDTNFVGTVDEKIHNALQPVKLSQGTDLDTLESTGLYTSDTDANTVTLLNKPDLTTGFILQVYSVYSSETVKRIIQVAYSRATGTIYTRTKSENANWTGWVKYLNNTDATSTNTTNKIVQRDGSGNFSAGTITAALSGNASTATKLATARKINGTSFDGSKDISTANWGATRDIAIGNSTKQVNGSGNVSWTLDEIGALSKIEDSTLALGKKILLGSTNAFLLSDDSPTLSTKSSINILADSDASSTSEYVSIKSGHNELKVTSSGGSTTVTQGKDKLTFNGNQVYHAGNKPTPSDIGAANASHNHTSSQITDATNANTANKIVKRDASGNFSAGTISATLSGNASTATKLQTARTINGVSFDGSQNITIADGTKLPHFKYTSISDLNNMKTTGVYSCAAASMTNAPTTNHGTLIVDFNVGTPYQIWIPDNIHTIFKRICSSGTWYPWTNSITGNCTSTDKVNSIDARNDDPSPVGRAAGLYPEFRANTSDGLHDGGSFHGVLHFRPFGWGDDLTGGPAHQLAFTPNGNLHVRTGVNTTTWNAWKKIAYANQVLSFYYYYQYSIPLHLILLM